MKSGGQMPPSTSAGAAQNTSDGDGASMSIPMEILYRSLEVFIDEFSPWPIISGRTAQELAGAMVKVGSDGQAYIDKDYCREQEQAHTLYATFSGLVFAGVAQLVLSPGTSGWQHFWLALATTWSLVSSFAHTLAAQTWRKLPDARKYTVPGSLQMGKEVSNSRKVMPMEDKAFAYPFALLEYFARVHMYLALVPLFLCLGRSLWTTVVAAIVGLVAVVGFFCFAACVRALWGEEFRCYRSSLKID